MREAQAEKTLKFVINELKKQRLAKGLSHERLAHLVGVTRPAISYIESGKCKPAFLLCLKIATALDISLGDLINESITQK